VDTGRPSGKARSFKFSGSAVLRIAALPDSLLPDSLTRHALRAFPGKRTPVFQEEMRQTQELSASDHWPRRRLISLSGRALVAVQRTATPMRLFANRFRYRGPCIRRRDEGRGRQRACMTLRCTWLSPRPAAIDLTVAGIGRWTIAKRLTPPTRRLRKGVGIATAVMFIFRAPLRLAWGFHIS